MEKKYDGYIDLKFKNKNNRTIASKIYHDGNSRVSSDVNIANETNTPYYFIINSGGGFIEAEKYKFDLEMSNDTRLILTTQSPTYIYKNENDLLTTQETNITLGDNSILEFISDEIIPYENSNYKQTTTVNMTNKSTLVMVDGSTAGWSKSDKPFTYNKLEMHTKIFLENKLMYNDHFISNPRNYDQNKIGYFENKKNFNSLIIFNEKCDEDFIKSIKNEIKEETYDLTYGISKLEGNGFVVRALSDSSVNNKRFFTVIINKFRKQILNLPDLKLGKNKF